LKSSRSLAAIALALTLALSGCAQGDTTVVVADDVYEFPAELIAAGEAATAVAPTTTVAPLREPVEPITPPPPRAAVEALNAPDPLPLPSSDLLPGVGTLEPFVVTDNGERRLLRDVAVTVSYDPETGLVVDPAGWWVVNYPLGRVVGAEGRSEDEVARLLTGRAAADLSNYYFYTAPESGRSGPDLPARDGPAPIKITAAVDLVVDNGNPGASDRNDGSRAHPLLTISEAVSPRRSGHNHPRISGCLPRVGDRHCRWNRRRAHQHRGDSRCIRSHAGHHRERPFPLGAWAEVDGMQGVYAAAAFTDLGGR
jgi:hypothetical protein